jgi:tetratricopeptide (TPR) repeat protein
MAKPSPSKSFTRRTLFGVGVLLGAASFGAAAHGKDVWTRAARPRLARERDVLLAVERVLLGRGNDYDVHIAQSAAVEYLSGQRFEDVRIEVLLVRLRLEAKWAYDAHLEKRALTTLSRPLPASLKGRAWADAGALSALRGDGKTTGIRMNEALSWAWENAPRTEALLGRGYASMADGHAGDAARDFARAATLAPSLRWSAASMASFALAEARIGRRDEALRAARTALSLDARRTSTLEGMFDGVSRVPAYDRYAVDALLWEARASVATEALDDEAAERAASEACESHRQYLLRAEPERAPWVGLEKRAWLACIAAPSEPRKP